MSDETKVPKSKRELQEWLKIHLGLEVPAKGIEGGGDSPLDYLAHAFFDGRVPGDDADGAGAGNAPGAGAAASAAPSPDCVLWACRGGGKTFLGAVATVLDLVFKHTIQIRILGGSLDQSRRMHEHLRALFEREWLAERVEGRITDRRIRLKSGSQVELLAQSETSVRGVRVQKLRCDEVELFSRELWAAAQLVTRSKRCGEHDVPGTIECLSTMHQPYGLMRDIVAEAEKGRRTLFRWGVLDVLERCGDEHTCEGEAGACPLLTECDRRAKKESKGKGHISVADAIAMKARVALATWEAEMLCRRPSTSHCVLPEFDAAVHVQEPPADQTGWWYCGGMDFGYRAPAVVLWAGVDPQGGLWILSERSERGRRLEEHIDAILRALPRPAWLGVDPAGRQANSQTGKADIDQLRQAGLRVRTRSSEIREGLELIRARLRPGTGPVRLHVSPRCETLIRSMESYHYDEKRPDAETPVKDGSDHAVDALRYLVLNLDRPNRTQRGRYVG